MTDKTKKEILYIHETVAQSWLRDASTFALFVALIGIGVLLESSAMQWIGAIIAFTSIAVRSSGRAKLVSIPEARRLLDELEARHHG